MGVKANNRCCRATSSISWAMPLTNCRAFVSARESFRSSQNGADGAERHGREARRVSSLARTNQTPYNFWLTQRIADLRFNDLRINVREAMNLQTEPIEEYKAPSEETAWSRVKKAFAPLGGIGVLIAKFFAKRKFVLVPLLKFLLILLKLGGNMLVLIWIYTRMWGWQFALGFVLLCLVHETGTL